MTDLDREGTGSSRSDPGAVTPIREVGSLELLDGVPPIGRAWLREKDLRGLDCGCGNNPNTGWLNVDRRPFAASDGSLTVPGRIALVDRSFYFLHHDMRERLPVEDASFDWIYSSHMIDQVRQERAIQILREMRRLLAPGGLLRLSTPDLRRFIQGYVDPEKRFFERYRRNLAKFAGGIPAFADGVPDRPGWMVNQIFYYWRHRWVYDLGEVLYVAEQAGFDPDRVEEVGFRHGREAAVSALDPPGHAETSLYVEITRE